MVIFYKKRKKYNEIQLTKNKMDLNIRKMTNHPPSPGFTDKTNLMILHRLPSLGTQRHIPLFSNFSIINI